MLDDLLARVPEALKQELPYIMAMVGVDEPERVQRPALTVWAPRGPVAREVRCHEGLPLLQLPTMDYPEPCSGPKLGPVGGLTEPVKVLAEEGVHRGARMHVGIGDDSGRVGDAVAALDGSLDVLKDLNVRVVVPGNC